MKIANFADNRRNNSVFKQNYKTAHFKTESREIMNFADFRQNSSVFMKKKKKNRAFKKY